MSKKPKWINLLLPFPESYKRTQAEMVIGIGSKSIEVTKNCWDSNTQVGIDCNNRCKEDMKKSSEFNQLSCIQEATN
jgi:hypothetical protein